MDYKKIYNSLVNNAAAREDLTGYFETHHIVPRSLGGADAPDNLVRLSAREHFLAHWLLYKIHTGTKKYKMAHAWFLMSVSSANQQRKTITSRQYEAMKKAHGKATSFFHAGKKLNEDQVILRQFCNPNSKPVTIGNICFLSVKYAAEYYKVRSQLIRDFNKGKITYDYLTSFDTRVKTKNKNISLSLKNSKNTSKGKTYEQYYGEEKAILLKDKKSKERKGNSFETLYGKEKSDIIKQKIASSRKGRPTTLGKKMSESSKHLLSLAQKNNRVQCEYCKLTTNPGNIARYHGKNCKYRRD